MQTVHLGAVGADGAIPRPDRTAISPDAAARAAKEHAEQRGYAVGFEGLVAYINDQLPQNEQIGRALRQQVRLYPETAIRELVGTLL